MFIKRVGSNYSAVYADESCTVWLGTAERVEREWYFEACASLGGKWAFGQTLQDAVEQTGVLEKVRNIQTNVRNCVQERNSICRITQ